MRQKTITVTFTANDDPSDDAVNIEIDSDFENGDQTLMALHKAIQTALHAQDSANG